MTCLWRLRRSLSERRSEHVGAPKPRVPDVRGLLIACVACAQWFYEEQVPKPKGLHIHNDLYNQLKNLPPELGLIIKPKELLEPDIAKDVFATMSRSGFCEKKNHTK